MDLWLTFPLILLFLTLAFYALSFVLLQWRVSRHYKMTGGRYAAMGLLGSLAFIWQIIRTILKLSWYLLTKNRKGLHPLRSGFGPKVLLIHGLHMNGNCFWAFRQSLEQAGFRTYSINLGKPYIPVERYIHTLHQVLDKIANGEKVHLVAHSMGGLVIRMLLNHHPEDARLIASVATLGTPHKGTAIIGDFALPWLKQLFHPASPELQTLPDICQMLPNVPVMTLGSRNDLVVYPLKNAMQPRARQVKLFAVSHIGLLCEPRVIQKVQRWIQAQQDTDDIGDTPKNPS
ncbi:alpha/beta fold hydrolase [Bowmanella yangjiangensis]|uniref:Alpha/beta fold hydrolase n=1 Tax=Bowmanella yangjiangensis TaxID=2811230 RepID=A0ABS3CV59_9ALTE|nr:alpha/beta fold hydrolase [Bowmanella yangjiangensis]MBN7820036.1 alpha/beta fold hydrolase [Bowmanella yangjiangensis]